MNVSSCWVGFIFLLLLGGIPDTSYAFTTSYHSTLTSLNNRCMSCSSPLLDQEKKLKPSLASSFYSDFEDFDTNDDDDDDDDDDDEYDLDDMDVAKFRSQMGSMFGTDEEEEDEDDEEEDEDDEGEVKDKSSISSVDDLINFATSSGGGSTSSSSGTKTPTDWANEVVLEKGMEDAILKPGMILLGNPEYFCDDFVASSSTNKKNTSPALLTKFGLTMPPPAEIGPDRRADLLPVLMIVDCHPTRGYQAVLMNRRTGYLLGDLEQVAPTDDNNNFPEASPPNLGAFMIQPLWFGGTSSSSSSNDDDDGMDGPMGGRGGLDMLHLCPGVNGAELITDDGIYWGGDPGHAQTVMQDVTLENGQVITGFDFKFFVQSTKWNSNQLIKEIEAGTWYVANVSKEVLFRSRDRLGPKRAMPLWTNIMKLLGGSHDDIRKQFYDL